MDHSEIYQYRFDELLKMLRAERELHNPDHPFEKPVINVYGSESRAYKQTLSGNEDLSIRSINKLIRGLFDLEGKSYSVPQGPKFRHYPIAMETEDNGRRTAYIFLYRLESGWTDIRDEMLQYTGIDEFRFYFLQNGYSDIIEYYNFRVSKWDSPCMKCFFIQDFFDEQFGKDEYPLFLEYVERFNENAKYIIGYKIVSIPTKEVIDRFRGKQSVLLGRLDYKSLIPDAIGLEQKKIILRNYLDRNRYKIMTGGNDFADSFIASEWQYQMRSVTGTIDQTGVVTGYLKSIEQLLYTCIRLAHITIGRIEGKGNIEQAEDTTLGSLIHAIMDDYKGRSVNPNHFDVDYSTLEIIIKELRQFKNEERNDHLHKDNIYSDEVIDGIRNKALLLYCLILGSIHLNSGDYAKLMAYDKNGVLPKSISEDDLMDIILKWATPIMMFDMPKEVDSIAFAVCKANGIWELKLQGLDKTEDYMNNESFKWNENPQYTCPSYNELSWNSEEDPDNEVEKLSVVLERIIEGKTKLSTMLKKYPEVVFGSGTILMVLYRKE